MTELIKHPVTEDALIKRLNRVLGKDDMSVKKTRGVRAFSTLGDYYILNSTRNFITEHHLYLSDLVDMAKERGVMATYENLIEIEVSQ